MMHVALILRILATASAPWGGPRCAFRFIALGLLTLALGCSNDAETTGVVVRIDAEPGLAADIVRITARVYGSDGRSATGGDTPTSTVDIDLSAAGARFPYTLGIAPIDWDATRTYRLDLDAYDASGARIASARIISGYVPARILAVSLLLEDACRGVTCSELTQTCKRAMCVDAVVDPDTLPEFGDDASVGAPDVGTATDAGADATGPDEDAGSVDAGSVDAGSVDAGPDDAGSVDAGSDDAGSFDAGPDDTGVDVGPPACGPGTTGEPGACVDVDECASGTPCDVRAVCTNEFGSFSCACSAGFTGDGFVCSDVDECASGNGGCDPLTTCTNTEGGHDCGACPDGYTGTGDLGCVDVDECAVNQGGCDPNSDCANTAGGFTCGACRAGFAGDGATGCTDVDECASGNGGCDLLTTCTNTYGGRSCSACPSGYTGVGEIACEDENECASGNGGCDPLTICDNTPGGFSCGACPAGYSGSGDTGCTDIDDCAALPCQNGSTCIDGVASYACACVAGWTGPQCEQNIDDCAASACQNGGTCIDGIASYTCSCPFGFTGTFCETVVSGCASSPCLNGAGCMDTGPGTYVCACTAGWTGDQCDIALDACVPTNPCANGGSCTSTGPGTFSCACVAGWTGATCADDVDECASGNGGCAIMPMVVCTNTPGGRTCGSCPTGYAGDGVACAPIDCGTPPTTSNATIGIAGGISGGATTTYGAIATYTCSTGFAKSGSDPTCDESGSWSGPAPVCTAIASFCPTAPNIANDGTTSPTVSGGVAGGTTTSFGATAVYTCSGGYSLSGSNAVCQASGTWSAAPSCGAISAYCPALTAPTNGSVSIAGGAAGGTTRSVNATATYGCNSGYGVSGSSTRTCQSNGTWSGTAPTCVDVNECTANTDGCDTVPDACVNSTGSYACTCPVNYVGTGVGSSGCLYDLTDITSLTVSGGIFAPAFVNGRTTHTVVLNAGVTNFTLTANTPASLQGLQTARFNGTVQSWGVARSLTASADAYTPTTVTFTVTAASGRVATHTVVVTRSHYLVATTGGGDNYVSDVAVSGDGTRIAFGDRHDGSLGQYKRGAVFVYRLVGGVWTYETVLRASDGIAHDFFGQSVAISNDGTTIAVGAPGSDGTGGYDSGAVYVYQNTSGVWAQQAKLLNADSDPFDAMGSDVDISNDGNYVVTGVPYDENGTTVDVGAAYVFFRSGTTWGAPAFLRASNWGAGDQFGSAVSISGDGLHIAIGAPYEDGSGTGIAPASNENAVDSGALYTYTRSGSTWSAFRYIKASNTGAGDHFGSNNSVSLSDDGLELIVGAPDEDSSATGVNGTQANESAVDAGAAYLFVRSTNWAQTAYVKASNTGAGDRFGFAATISGGGTRFIVGAPNEDSAAQATPTDNSLMNSGAAYIFQVSAPAQLTFFKASSPMVSSGFGWATSCPTTPGIYAIVSRDAVGGTATPTVDGISRVDTSRTDRPGAVYIY